MLHSCVTCSKTFSRASNLRRHKIQVHGNSRAYVCPVCDRTYKRNSDLRNHTRRSHRGEALFSCSERRCHVMFTSAELLANHVAEAHAAAGKTAANARKGRIPVTRQRDVSVNAATECGDSKSDSTASKRLAGTKRKSDLDRASSVARKPRMTPELLIPALLPLALTLTRSQLNAPTSDAEKGRESRFCRLQKLSARVL
jgi:uncharacterized C2H2 Zn-finger protein